MLEKNSAIRESLVQNRRLLYELHREFGGPTLIWMWNAKAHILIAEDDANDAHLFQRVVKKIGLTNPIHIVSDGEEAIEYLSGAGKFQDREQFPFPDIIITDLKMPRKNGFDVLAWLSKHPECSTIPTIVWTSSAVESDVFQSYSLGANCYLQKPNSPDDWEETIRLLFKFWGVCQKPVLALTRCAEENPNETA